MALNVPWYVFLAFAPQDDNGAHSTNTLAKSSARTSLRFIVTSCGALYRSEGAPRLEEDRDAVRVRQESLEEEDAMS